MSPWLTPSVDAANATCTTAAAPAASVTRANPTRRCGGTTTPLLTGCATYTGTVSVPAVEPVLATVNVAVAVPFRPILGVTERLDVWNVVYESPYPNG